MISTLRANNGSFANLGSIAVQAVNSVITEAANQLASTHPSAVGVLPTSQVRISVPIVVAGATLTRTASTSLSEIGLHLTTGSPVVIPLSTHFNTLMPTYHLSLNTGREYDPRVNAGFVTTTTKFQPYEQLTGIAQERPEIVMVTNFEPLFNKDVIHTAPNFITALNQGGIDPFMTPAGMYLDTQIQIRNLRTYNSQALLRTLSGRYTNISSLIQSRTSSFQNALNELNTDASFLLNLVRIIEAQKAQLDLRHDIYTVDPSQVGSLTNANYVQQQQTAMVAPDGQRIRTTVPSLNRHPPQYDLVDVLTSLGYKEATVQQIYSSTKVWMQVLLELSYALKFHTLQFIDIDPSYQRNDTNPTTILNPKVTRFSLSTNLPQLPPLSELINLQPALIAQTINAINPAFTTIYQNVLFKDEEARIAALAHLLSMEYRYSNGLTQLQTQQTLSGYYGYQVNTSQGNTSVFDAVIGKFGNNITDFPVQNNNALTAVAQQTAGTTGVLTFESKYVEGDTGTLTPGGDYYFDQLLQTTGAAFNTANIDKLTSTLEFTSNNFNIIVDSLNLMAKPTVNSNRLDSPVEVENSVLDTTGDLINSVKAQLVDANGNTSQMLQNDRLASVFAFARKDNKTKAALFMYVMAKISRAYNTVVPFFTASTTADNTPLVDDLIGQVNTAIQAALPITRTAIQYLSEFGFDTNQVNSPNALNPAGVSTALKAGTPLTTFIFTLMGQILNQFQVRTKAIYKGYSVYSGYLDTAVMMLAFDLITSAIARYGNLELTGQTLSGFDPFSAGTLSYVVSQTTTNHSNSINELVERALGEDTRVQQMILTVQQVLTALGGSLKGISNYLKSPTSVQILQQVSLILGNDQTLISMLFSEQQIMMLASTVSNLLTATSQGLNAAQKGATQPTNDSQEVQILDESQVQPDMRNALLGYFGSADFASNKGANKRVLTVGIPAGFTQRIKQKINIQQQTKASFTNRRNDLVQVCVYKVDMVNSDIVYKPRRFLFEMSRFPVRVSTVPWLPLPAQPDPSDIVNAVPTLNFSQNADTSTSTSITQGIEYASAVIAGNDGIKNAQQALDDASYSFMSTNQKAQLLQNHVVSQLLEVYIKLMTGLNVAEYNFDMADVPPPLELVAVKTITEHAVANVADAVQAKATAAPVNKQSKNTVAGGVLFTTTSSRLKTPPVKSKSPKAIAQPQLTHPSGVAGFSSTTSQMQTITPALPITKTIQQTEIVGDVDANLSSITPRNVPLVTETFRTVNGLMYTMSSVSDPASLNQKIVVPKQFDRVFNVIIDPTDFEVDVVRTTATPYGASALNLMIQNGDIVPMTENEQASFQANPITTRSIQPGSRPFIQGRAAPNVNAFRFRDRDTSQGDLIADKYFITIETFDEGT